MSRLRLTKTAMPAAPPASVVDISPPLLMASTDFLTGVASAASTLTIVVTGTQIIV